MLEVSGIIISPDTPIAALGLIKPRPSQIARNSRDRITRYPHRHSGALLVHSHLANSKYLVFLESSTPVLVHTLILSVLLSEFVVKGRGTHIRSGVPATMSMQI